MPQLDTDTNWLQLVDTNLLQGLMQAGYLATGDGRFTEARTIFKGLTAVRPTSEHPWLGLAVTEMSAGEFAAADEAIAQAKLRNPTAPQIPTFQKVLDFCRVA